MANLVGAIGGYPHTREFLEAPLPLDGGDEIVIENLHDLGGFDRLWRNFAHDLFEFPFLNYVSAREHGVPITALPVFVTRDFMHSTLVWNRNVVDDPKALEGKRVGIRYHGFTDGTWARGLLEHDFGVDLAKVTWVTCSPERVAGAALPPNAEFREGAALDELLLSGELAGLVMDANQKVDGPGIGPIYDDLEAAERRWFDDTGVLPILHTVVVKDDVLAAHPDLAARFMAALAPMKERAIKRLEAGVDLDERERKLVKNQHFVGRDPRPDGIEANRVALELGLRYATDLGVIEGKAPVEELFVAVD